MPGFARTGSVKLCVAVSVVLTTVGVGVSAGWAQQPQAARGSQSGPLVAPTSPPRKPVGADPEALRRFVAKRDEARRDKKAARDSEGERRERRASRSRYRDLDSGQARELARRHLKRAFERRDPVKRPGVSVDAYLGERAARVELASGQKAIVESLVPLRSPDASGALKPIDFYPNLNFWAPPEHRADTVLGKPDGGHRLKQHRLRWRWPTLEQATWMCSAGAGDRNVELEVRPFPRREPRWSDNWEDNDARDLTRWNIPGNIHQDDLADGQRPFDGQPGDYPYDKNQYPDFSIIAQSSDLYQARREYFVDFTTNEGDTDVGGPVIFSAQSTSRAVDDPGLADENMYCTTRGRDYKSCMFGRTNTCYAHRDIADPRARSRVNWATGAAPDHFQAARSGSPNVFDPTARNEVVQRCDPKPPGADDSNDDRAVRSGP